MYELLGCSTHYGVPNKGDGLTECVRTLNQRLLDHPIREIPEQTLPEENLPNLKYLNSVAATCWDIAAAVDEIKRRGNTPLFTPPPSDRSPATRQQKTAWDFYGLMRILILTRMRPLLPAIFMACRCQR